MPTATPEEPIFSPTAEELSEAQRIHDRYVQAMRNELTGAVALGGELVDAASLRLAERILARGRAAGMEPPAIEDPGAAR